MRFSFLFILALMVAVFGEFVPRQAHAQASEVNTRYGLDPTSPLISRVREAPESVLKMFDGPGMARPKAHTLTAQERKKLVAAFAALPPLHRKILQERLRSMSFLDGMPNNALTSTVNPDDFHQLFDITVRAATLNQNVSEWLSEKEQTLFDASGSTMRVSVEAGKWDSLVFLLLHEATHVVDGVLEITPHSFSDAQPAPAIPPTAFTKGVWTDRTAPAPAYHDSLRERIRFRPGGAVLAIDQAIPVYQSLRQTPFVSLYGSSNWFDDLAEFAAVYHWTQVLKQPYRIIVRDGKKERFAYEPMKSPLVRSRFDQMKPFY